MLKVFISPSQVRWDSHHHGNNIPHVKASFQKMNFFVTLHSSVFSNKNVWNQFELTFQQVILHAHKIHLLSKILQKKHKCVSLSSSFIHSSSLFHVPTQYYTSHSIINLVKVRYWVYWVHLKKNNSCNSFHYTKYLYMSYEYIYGNKGYVSILVCCGAKHLKGMRQGKCFIQL